MTSSGSPSSPATGGADSASGTLPVAGAELAPTSVAISGIPGLVSPSWSTCIPSDGSGRTHCLRTGFWAGCPCWRCSSTGPFWPDTALQASFDVCTVALQTAFAAWTLAFQASFAAWATAATRSVPARRHRGRWRNADLWSEVSAPQRPCPTSAARRAISTVAINSPKPALLKTGRRFSSSKGARAASTRDHSTSRGRESSGKAVGSSSRSRASTGTP